MASANRARFRDPQNSPSLVEETALLRLFLPTQEGEDPKLLRPKAKRAAAKHAVEVLGLSERLACRVAGLSRATWFYEQKPESDENKALRKRIREIAAQRRRFGAFRIWRILTRREGWKVNIKRVRRIYNEEKLSLRLKRRQKRSAAVRVPLPVPTGPNQVWSIDFVWDRLSCGRRLKMLTVVDDFSRECLEIKVDFGINGLAVTKALDRLIELRGKVLGVRMDNGPEFSGNEMDAWGHDRGILLDFIDAGKPNQNAYIESFNGRFREECLNDNQFKALIEAQVVIEAWRRDYNEERPHSSLDGLTPNEFAARHNGMLNKLCLKEHQFALV